MQARDLGSSYWVKQRELWRSQCAEVTNSFMSVLRYTLFVSFLAVVAGVKHFIE